MCLFTVSHPVTTLKLFVLLPVVQRSAPSAIDKFKDVLHSPCADGVEALPEITFSLFFMDL